MCVCIEVYICVWWGEYTNVCLLRCVTGYVRLLRYMRMQVG